MTHSMTVSDPRLLARIINATFRFGCTYTRVIAHGGPTGHTISLEFAGPSDALRRLEAHVTKLIADDKENSR